MDRLRIVLVLFVCCMAGFISCTGKGQQAVVPDDVQPFVHTSDVELNANPDPYLNETYVKHIVVLKPGVPQQVRDSIAGSLTKSASHLYNTVFVGFATDISQNELQTLTADNQAAYVEEAKPVSLCIPVIENNPGADPWGIRDNLAPPVAASPAKGPIRYEGDNPVDWGVSRINAFPSPGLKGAGLTVAIVDTGIDLDHPDLAGAIVAEYDAVNDLEGAGTANDLHGHGTHVAGIVGARDNDIGTVGVAPECSFAAIKVFPGASGGGSDADLIRGIDWMAANQNVVVPPIKVANMSLSGTGTSKAMYDAIQACNDLGITTVVAAGNDFRDASQQMPANFDNVITVSAMKRVWNGSEYDYEFAMFSNWGNTVDLIAPGQSILSLRNNGATRYASGTSMACPHVAGVAALYLDENLADGFAEVRAALIADGEAGTWVGDPDGVNEPLVDCNDPRWYTLTIASFGIASRRATSLKIVDESPAICYNNPATGNLMYIRATNAEGSNWGTPVAVDIASGHCDYPFIAIVVGNPAISYYRITGGNGTLKYVRAADSAGSTWGTPLALGAGSGIYGAYTSLATVNGNPAISYSNHTNRDLMFIRATNPEGGNWDAPMIVDAPGSVGWCSSMAIVNGNPAISYADWSNFDLKYVQAIDANGSAWGIPIAVDTIGTVGSHTSLAIVDGNPTISYSGNGDLKYVRAVNPDGNTWGAPLIVDAPGNVGRYTSLAIVNGQPAISYLDLTNFDLKYVQGTDSGGSAWSPPVAVDTIGSVGWYTSLCVVNGNPAISYWDDTNKALKYAYYGP